MHWKENHFATIIGEANGRYHVKDPMFPGGSLWVTPSALDAEASGYFLLPASNALQAGWAKVTDNTASHVWGRGATNAVQPGDAGDPLAGGSPGSSPGGSPNGNPNGSPNGGPNGGCPMCSYGIKAATVGLTLSDQPVGYTPPIGPAPKIIITYNQREDSQPASFGFYNVSQKWTLNWLSYITDNPTNPGASVSRYLPGGGAYYYTGYNSSTGKFATDRTDNSILELTQVSPVIYKRLLPDGTVDVYAQSDGSTSYPRHILLSQVIDPQGNALTLNYDSQMRLISMTDAIGQQTTFSYGDAANDLLVTQITDPFGRSASFTYDSSGRLASITDILGLTSSFTYDANSLVNSMTTPYGTTSFAYTAPGASGPPRFLDITDPLGYHEREEWVEPAPNIPSSDPTATVPTGMPVPLNNAYLQYRDSFHWDKATYITAGCSVSGGCDYTKAVDWHFCHVANTSTKSTTIESIKNPLENRIWYNYPGQSTGYYTGTFNLPSATGRVLSTGASQISHTTYSTSGWFQPTQTIDPLGRTTNYTYESDNVDLASITQKNGSGADTLLTATWNSQHRPLTITDAAGYKTSYTYNSVGQILTKTDALGDVTSYAYANQAGTGAGNFLHTITDANNVVIATYTYDTAGRVATYTDSQGYTLSYSYDNANRLTQITYPDGTTTKYGYTNLDLTSVTDRLGRTTTYTYDANRKLISVKDPLGHTMTYGYDPDGRLTSLTDPMGHVTTWTRDLEGRIVTKTYPDGTTTNYTYDITGRLATRVDALHQTTTYSYATDDLLSSKTYTNTVNPTPNVTYTWDSAYPRLASMTDGSGPGGGTGTTAFTYWPVGYAGALQSAQEQGPNGSADTYLNVYDTLGRFWGRFTGGLTVSDTYLTYDAINRPTSDITPMGTFNYNYLGETQQISSWGLASGATTATINYQPNADDRRYLQTGYAATVNGEITSSDAGSGAGYLVGGLGRITAKLLQTNTSGNFNYDTYGYDAADRLTSDAGYSYTPSGGYTPLYTNNFTYNSNDFLLSGGYPSNLNPFLGSFTATPKSNSDEISSVTYTNSIGPTTYNYTYDADGNLVSDGANTYLWDAENRLIGINYASGGGTKFRYDGLNRRVAIIETVNGTSTETDYLWCGQKLCASYTPSGTVTARYMPQGEAQYSGSTQTNLYYQFDHLGSVIGVTDSAGNQKWTPQHGGYYSPWGLSLFQGSVTPTFQFAGMFYHGPSGLYLTLNRVYDPKTARWISRDPAGELFDPVGNLYTYVGGDPVNNIDPLGLAAPWAPYPPSNIPGGPWSPAPGQRPGAYYGPKQPSGGRPMCQYVPPGDQGGPPGSKGYWKTQQPGQKGWGQRYNQQGEPITPDEAHPGPSGSAPPEPASPTPEPSVPEVPEVPPIIEIP